MGRESILPHRKAGNYCYMISTTVIQTPFSTLELHLLMLWAFNRHLLFLRQSFLYNH